MPTVRERTDQLAQRHNELAQIFAKHRGAGDADDPGYKAMDEATLADIRARNAELGELQTALVAAKAEEKELAEIERANAEERARLEKPARLPFPGKRADDGGPAAGRKSLGTRFVEHAEFGAFQRGQLGAKIAFPELEAKTLFQTSAGWDPEDLRTGRVIFDEQQAANMVAPIIPKTTTRMSTVLYMEETTYTSGAAEIAEGATYGESAFQLTERSSEVRKIALFVPITDEQLEDVDRIRDYLDNRLRNQLAQRLDLQILTGNGTAPNLRGVLNVSGINTQAKGADPSPDAIHKAITKCRVNGFAEPDYVIMHPNDWQDFAILRDANGNYIWGRPNDAVTPRIWGKPVIQTTYETENTAVLGDFAGYSELSMRRGIEFEMTNAHSTYFTEGKKAVRADFRCALIFYRALAFCTVTGL